jgi:hypothetical protein
MMDETMRVDDHVPLLVRAQGGESAQNPVMFIVKTELDTDMVQQEAHRMAREQGRDIFIVWCEDFYKDEEGVLQIRQSDAHHEELMQALRQYGSKSADSIQTLLKIDHGTIDVEMPVEQALTSGISGMWSSYWERNEEGTPIYIKHHDNGTVVEMRPDLKSDGVYDVNLFRKALEQEMPSDVMDRIVKQLGPRAVDHAMLVIAYGFSPDVREKTLREAPFDISLRDMLRARGVKVRGAQFGEALESARKDIYAASSLMLDLTETYDPKRKKSYHWKTRLFAVTDEIKVTQGDLFASEEAFDYRMRVSLGGWSRRYIQNRNPLITNFPIKALRLWRSGPEELAKKIVQCLTVRASVDRSASIRADVEWVLQEVGELHPDPSKWPQDRKWKGRLRERFDAAMEIIFRERLATVGYPEDYAAHRRRSWFDEWLKQELEVVLPGQNATQVVSFRSTMPTCIETVQDLIALREFLGLTKAQMAKKLGVSSTLICLVEGGKRPLSRRLLGGAQNLQKTALAES